MTSMLSRVIVQSHQEVWWAVEREEQMTSHFEIGLASYILWVVLELPLEGSVVGFAGGNKEEAQLGHTLSSTDWNVEGMWVLGSNVGLGDSIKVGFAKICRELTLTLSFFHGKL